MKRGGRKYVLGESAAAALRPLLQRGAKFGSRPREIHDPDRPPEYAPFYVKPVEVSGDLHAYVYTPATNGDPNRNSLVTWANGNVPPSSALAFNNPWHDAGAWDYGNSIWLVVTPPSFDASNNIVPGYWTISQSFFRPTNADLVYKVAYSIKLAYRQRVGEGGKIVHYWPGGVFAFAGPTLAFSAVSSITGGHGQLTVKTTHWRWNGHMTPTTSTGTEYIPLTT